MLATYFHDRDSIDERRLIPPTTTRLSPNSLSEAEPSCTIVSSVAFLDWQLVFSIAEISRGIDVAPRLLLPPTISAGDPI